MQHQDHRDFAAISRQSKFRQFRRHDLPGRNQKATYTAAKTRCCVESVCFARLMAQPSLSQESAAQRARHGDFLQRQHRRTQGRHAVALEYHLEHRRHPPGDPVQTGDKIMGVSAVVSFLWIYRHALAARCSPGFGAVYHPNPTDAKTIGETDSEISRYPADQHADFFCRVSTPLHQRRVRLAALLDRRRRETTRADRQELRGEIRLDDFGRLRLHRAVAGRGRQYARCFRRQGNPNRAQARHRRPTDSRRRGQSRRPGNRASARSPAKKDCCWSWVRM